MSSSSSSTPAPASLPPTTDLTDRPLSELTDAEISELTSAQLQSTISSQPLVSELEPIGKLKEEYKHAATFLSKIDGLEEGGWKSVRKVRGDGDCFYRAFAFAYVERLLHDTPTTAQNALSKLDSLIPLLDQAGFAKDIYEEFYDPLRLIILSLSPSASSTRPSASELLASFNDPETSNSIVVFLRLLTSAYLKANADDFTPFLFGLEDDPRFFGGGAPTMEQFCSFHVEAVNKDADHIQITALTRALQIHTTIAYLDQSGTSASPFSSTSGDADTGKVDFHEFEEGSKERMLGAFLYRPGHYDILVQGEVQSGRG